MTTQSLSCSARMHQNFAIFAMWPSVAQKLVHQSINPNCLLNVSRLPCVPGMNGINCLHFQIDVLDFHLCNIQHLKFPPMQAIFWLRPFFSILQWQRFLHCPFRVKMTLQKPPSKNCGMIITQFDRWEPSGHFHPATSMQPQHQSLDFHSDQSNAMQQRQLQFSFATSDQN